MAKAGNNSVRNSITDQQIKEAMESSNGNISEAARLLGVNRRTLSNIVNKQLKPEVIPLAQLSPDSKLKVKQKTVYFITSAQNNAEINTQALNAVKGFLKYNDAQLLVIPVRYKNVTAFLSGEDIEATWPIELTRYYLNDDIKLNNNLGVLGTLSIQATTQSPLAGIHNAFSHSSAIVGHNQIAFKTIASPPGHLPRQLYTTGTISLPHYSDTVRGYKAKQNHGMGGCVVEVSEDMFLVRHVEFDPDGSFYDLQYKYKPDGKREKANILALKMGDLHCDFVDPDVLQATFLDKNSICNTLNPEYLFLDDALDFNSQNHHHKKDIYTRYANFKAGRSGVRAEIDRLINMHNSIFAKTGAKVVYTDSNHNSAFGRWLREAKIENDLENLDFYHEMQSKMLACIGYSKSGADVPNPLKLYAEPLMDGDPLFISNTQPFNLMGVEYSQHGDKGINGARGSINSLASTGFKMMIGHSHSPGRKRGVLQTGTSSYLDLKYLSGLSSWLQTHGVQYQNGAMTHLNIIQGKWRIQ